MMRRVTGHDVGHGPHRKCIAARRSLALPGLGRKVSEEREGREADLAKLLNMTGPGNRVGSGCANGDVLFKAGQGTIKPAGEPECARDEDSLRIVDVIPQLADAPFVRRVPIERLLFGNTTQDDGRLIELAFEHAENVAACDAVNVIEVIL